MNGMNEAIEQELLKTKTRDEFRSVCVKHGIKKITGEHRDVLLHHIEMAKKETGGVVVHRDVFK